MAVCLVRMVSAQNPPEARLLRNDAIFEYGGPTRATYSRSFTILIPDKAHSRYALFSCDVNNGRTKLKSFSGEVTEGSGKPRKLKRSDLEYTEYSDGLADSYGTYYFSPGINSYPATVTYSYEISYTDAVLGMVPFEPLPFASGVSLESATYTLKVPSSDCFSYKALNMPGVEPEQSETSDGLIYKWTVSKLPAGVSEPNSPPANERLKVVLFTSSEFSYEGNTGSGKSWKSIGDWIESLSAGLPGPPEELRDKVKTLTEGCATDLEKIGRIYKYLGETTRYVSIQLGLGGLRPLDPGFVFKNKFGDCKALSWYMKSMLDCCGIPSDYVIINMGADALVPDFPSLATTNHAILSVPVQGDTLWIECTDPEVPLGYVHGGIAGNHALVVKKGESYVTRLPWPDSAENTDTLRALVTLNAGGSAQAIVEQTVGGYNWESFHELAKMSSDKRADLVKNGLTVPMATISNLSIDDSPGPKPHCSISYEATASTYASKTGMRLFVPADPFRNYPDRTTRIRNNDLYFKTGWEDNDIITIKIPDGYEVESGERDFVFDNKFGHIEYSMNSPENTGEVTIKLSVRHNPGKFPKEDYEEYRVFRKNIWKVAGGNIVLVRK